MLALVSFWMIDSLVRSYIHLSEDTIKIYEQMLDSNMQHPGHN